MVPNPIPRILLAEDNPADVYMVELALKENGVAFELEVAPTGKEALCFLNRVGESPGERVLDLILLDLNLPQHDGTEILRHIRASQRLCSVPVVLFTSSDSPRDRTLALTAGANRYIRKPSDLESYISIGAVLKEMLAGGLGTPEACSAAE